MALSSTNPPPENHDPVQQYLDQHLTDLSQSFQSQVDVLAEQVQQLSIALGAQPTAASSPGPGLPAVGLSPTPMLPVPPVGAHPDLHDQRVRGMAFPADHGPTPQRYPPQRWPPRCPPPPRHGVLPELHAVDPRPALHERAGPPPFTRDTHPYIDDLPLYGTDNFDGDVEEDLQAGPIHPIVHHRALPPRQWESRFKLEIPEFHGTHSADEFLDWLTATEQVFHSASVPSPDCVGLVVTKFRGGALAWWRALLARRSQVDKPPITT